MHIVFTPQPLMDVMMIVITFIIIVINLLNVKCLLQFIELIYMLG